MNEAQYQVGQVIRWKWEGKYGRGTITHIRKGIGQDKGKVVYQCADLRNELVTWIVPEENVIEATSEPSNATNQVQEQTP